MPRVAGWITGQRKAYAYLSTSVESFPSGAAMCRLLTDNGFATAEAKPLNFGIASIYLAGKLEEHALQSGGLSQGGRAGGEGSSRA